jgi:hypothetical protein
MADARRLALAAATALAVGTVVLLSGDDDKPHDTTQATPPPTETTTTAATTSSSSAGVPVVDPDAGYAIWPITQPGQPISDVVAFRGTLEATAVAFAAQSLGWRDAVVSDREPSEDGRGGGVYLVTSEEIGGAVLVWTALGTGTDGNVVYHLDSPARRNDPEATASVSVQEHTGMAHVTPEPPRTVSTSVAFSYGDFLSEGPAGSPFDVARDLGVPGAVVVLFGNVDGTPISAWGTTLPAGDFAAG